MRYFTSDTHFGHANIIAHCNRPFECVEDMDEALIKGINDTVGRKDELFILGDFARRDEARWRNRIICRTVHLIIGNHDRRARCEAAGFASIREIAEVKSGYRRLVLCHYPFEEWPGYFHGAIHLHGHQHNGPEYNAAQAAAGRLRYDVGVDANGYRPVSEDEIRAFFGIDPA